MNERQVSTSGMDLVNGRKWVVVILRCGVARCADTRVDVPEIRLALRCLLPHCPEKWPLALYWDSGSQTNDIGRAQGVTAAFNGIVRQLRRAGCYEENSPV